MKELDDEDPKCLNNFIRMNRSSFCDLLDKVSPLISKEDTTMRQAISTGERLAVTHCYLAFGNYGVNTTYICMPIVHLV